MALKFGTSGVRGLVTEMTDRECYLYTAAFCDYVKTVSDAVVVSLGGDLRSSTPRIMRAVARAIHDADLRLDYLGFLPTPTLTYHAMMHGYASVMVTGSHIPDDRNGIKFNLPWGEVLKGDEGELSRRYRELKGSGHRQTFFDADGQLLPRYGLKLGSAHPDATDAYLRRYLDFFPRRCLQGLRVVVWQHSSTARDLLPQLLDDLGAEVIRVGRSNAFVAVDTEAVENLEELRRWVHDHGADALVSADGDGDRPLVVDDDGNVVRGDVLGILVAAALDADSVATPVSCTTALEKCGVFADIRRTRIGSPYVIAAMQEASASGHHTVVGYEANGGFLTNSEMHGNGEPLTALPTRDAVLPILTILHAAVHQERPLSAMVNALPPRYTVSGLVRPVPREQGQAVIARATDDPATFAAEFLEDAFGDLDSSDFTDGARFVFSSDDIVHLRPSGNAPEFRVYTEAETRERAAANNDRARAIVREAILPAVRGE